MINAGSFAEGLQGDIMQLVEAGAGVIQKSLQSIKLIFPFASDQSLTQNSSSDEFNLKYDTSGDDLKYRLRQTQDALKMRCSSMWNEKKTNSIDSTRKSIPQGGQDGGKGKEGGKVQLDKLLSNKNILVSLSA